MKKLLATLLCIILAFSLVACSGEPADDVATDGDTSSTTDSADDAGEGMCVAVSLGWMENASGQRQKMAFEEAFAAHGITNYDIVDANYDAKKQSEQIQAFVAKKPDALFITPSDPVGISEAVKTAAEAGVKIYSSDGLVPGAEVVSTVMFDNYAGGMATMEYLANTLLEKYPEGDIVIGMVTLPSNEGWDMREHGAKFVLENPKYDRIKVEYEWPWDSTGAVTPTDTISSWMAADVDKDIKAIWSAWDGAAFEGLAVTATTRPEIVYTGSDGGEECYKKMAQYPNQFIITLAESVYAMPTQLTGYAVDSHEGRRVPRIVMSPGYAITSQMITEVDSIKDEMGTVNGESISAWQLALDYDLPGYTDALNVVLEANNLVGSWLPTV